MKYRVKHSKNLKVKFKYNKRIIHHDQCQQSKELVVPVSEAVINHKPSQLRNTVLV